MANAPKNPLSHFTLLVLAWLGLALLTLVSTGLGTWLRGASVLPLLVAAIIWVKAQLVARYYLELHSSHVFIRRLVSVFIAFVPVALVLTDLFGDQIAAWLTL
jgi:hypothetical protein